MFKYSVRPYFFLSRDILKIDYRRFFRFRPTTPSFIFVKLRKFINFVVLMRLVIPPSKFDHTPINLSVFLSAFCFHWFFTLMSKLLGWNALLSFYYKRFQLEIFSKPFVFRWRKNKGLPLKFAPDYFLICKRTRTNNYLTFVNRRGEVLYFISAGMLGIRKPWERHRVPTFIRMVDRCYSFVKKRKLTREFDCILTSYNKTHFYTVMKRSYKFFFKVRMYRFMPKLVHGRPLKRKRIKRL